MMGCISTELHVVLARKSTAREEVSSCDSDAESSDGEELLQSSSAEEKPELPEGHLLRKYGLRFSDTASVGPSIMKADPAIPKVEKVKVAWPSGEIFLHSYSIEDNLLKGLNTSKAMRGRQNCHGCRRLACRS